MRIRTGIADEIDVEVATVLDGTLRAGDRVAVGVRRDDADGSNPTLPGFGMRWRRTQTKKN